MGKTPRKSFAKQDQILELPNMLKIQKDSYEWFLREGLREVFRDVDTITDYTGNLELSFLDYSMNEPPKYSVEECKERDATYAKPIKVRVRLHNKETDEIKEQEIFMGHRLPDRQKPRRLLRRRGRQDRPAHLFRNGHSVPRRVAGI